MKKVLILILAVIMLIAAAGCSGTPATTGSSSSNPATPSVSASTAAPAASSGNKEKVLTVMYPYTNDTLDPKIDYAQLMRSGIGEALFKCDENLKIQPWLAESYTGSADSTEYTITLKKGIKFSNGKDCDAEAVRVWFERMIKENNAMRTSLNVKSMEADGLNLKIICNAPNPILINELSQPQAVIIDLEAGNFDMKPVTTGPYKIDTFTPSTKIDMVRNENYWNGEVPYDRVLWIVNSDASSRQMALESGDADVIAYPSFDVIPQLEAKDGISVVKAAIGARATYISYNCAQKYMSNKEFRTAIDYLIDRETIVDSVYNKMAAVALGCIPGGLETTPDYVNHTYNIDKALEHFKNAGLTVTNGKVSDNGKPITLRFGAISYQSEMPVLAQVIQADLAKVGITAELTMIPTDIHTWLGDKNNDNSWDICTCSSFAVPKGDPFNILNNAFYETSVYYYLGLNDPKLKSMIDAIRGEGDKAKRTQLLKEAALYIEDQAYVGFVCNPLNVLVYNDKKVTGVIAYPNESYISTGKIAPVK